jgi:hypothetical protein
MMRIASVVAAAALLLGACASPPPQSAPVSRYERDMRKAEELQHEGRLAAAAASYRAAIAYGERHDDSARLAPALLGLGGTVLEIEDFARAGAAFEQAWHEAGRAARPDLQQAAALGSAETARRRGDCAQAERGAEALLGPAADPALHWRARLLQANCQLARGDGRKALATLDALSAGKVQSPALESARLAARAAALLASGEVMLAGDPARAALDIDKGVGYPPAIAADHALLARIAIAAADSAAARLHAQIAQRIYRHTGQQRAAERLVEQAAAAQQ